MRPRFPKKEHKTIPVILNFISSPEKISITPQRADFGGDRPTGAKARGKARPNVAHHCVAGPSVRLPNARQQAPANLTLVLTVSGEMVPKRPIFSRCSRNEEQRSHDRGQQSPDRLEGEWKGQVSEQRARVAGMPNQGIGSGTDNRVTAICLDSYESRKERVGVDCPVREAIARRIDEKPCHLNDLRHREDGAEANGIEASHDERRRV